MDAERWRKLSAIFDVVSESPECERSALLDRLCGTDDVARCAVQDLLAADVLGEVLDAHAAGLCVAAAAAWTHDHDASAAPGTLIGSWRVVHELGRGGMGVVLLVDRADGLFEHRAALKLIRRGLDSDALLARFLRERQILARLSHPNIARLLDGGVAADGRSFLVMEYVEGVPLPDYCAQRRLDLGARIECVLQICAALQFAHRQLVVHLDIKPSNVLVTESGEVKLLDFGVARLLGAEQSAVDSGVDPGPLTPAYAAPEQLRGDPVTTATDIYSLGCVAYELLSGTRPFHDGADPMAVRDRTSARPEPPSMAAQGNADSPTPARMLRGDLDAIVLKALDREPERRYVTVEALAQDLRSYARGLPVAACRDTAWYRTTRFMRRHRLGAALAAAALAGLLLTTTIALREARNAREQAQRAQTVTDFLIGTFRVADPRGTPGGARFSAKDVLDSGAKRLETELAREPQLAASLAEVLGKVYRELGEYDRAVVLLQRSLLLRHDPGHDADTLALLARAQYEKGDYAGASQSAVQALEIHRARGESAAAMVASDLGLQGEIARRQGNFARAEVLLKQALDMSRAALVAPHAQIAAQLNQLATLYSDMHRLPEGMALTEQALTMFRALYGDNHLDVAENLVNLAVFRMQTDHIVEALPLFDEAVAIYRRLLPADHAMLAEALAGHARALDRLGRYAEAEPLYMQALAMQRRLLGNQHPGLAATLNNLAVLHFHQDDYAAAADFSRQAMAIWAAQGKPEHPFALISKSHLAAALRESGDLVQSERIGREVLDSRRRLPGDNNLAVSISLDDLGMTLRVGGHSAEALALQRQARDLREKVPGVPALEIAAARVQYALSESAAGDEQAARADVDAALAQLMSMATPNAPQIASAQVARARIALMQHEPAVGCEAAQRALALRPPDDPVTGWRHAEAQSVDGECLAARKQFAAARRELQSALTTLQRTRGVDHWMTRQTARSLQSIAKT